MDIGRVLLLVVTVGGLSLGLGSAVATWAGGSAGARAEAAAASTTVRWFGQSCFLITSGSGVRVLTDPYDPSIGLGSKQWEADLVTVSHEHYDHNNVGAVKGNPKVVRKPGTETFRDVALKGVATSHDEVKGARRGPNTVFVITVDGIRFCHLGDLGEVPAEATAAEIGPVDILMAPVGGTYTIDAAGANRVVNLMKPKVVIPMHYKLPALVIGLDGVSKFLAGKERVVRPDQLVVEFSSGALPEQTTVYVLKHE